jgi:Domain of unknown function (DUF4258)
LKQPEALREIRARAHESHNVAFVSHAGVQMRKRGIDRLQVIRCLQRGRITEGPYRDIRSGQWRCNVEATVSGDSIRVVVEIPDKPPLLEVITVISLE